VRLKIYKLSNELHERTPARPPLDRTSANPLGSLTGLGPVLWRREDGGIFGPGESLVCIILSINLLIHQVSVRQ